jgi:aminoglycoside phosphotransferase (APT) family kinase protein
MSQIPGINKANVSAWYQQHLGSPEGPLQFELIAGGRSNLTYIVTDSQNTKTVLRRPPLGHLLPSAHDVGREHRIISALKHTAVPVPTALGFCNDPAVNDRPFYVMAFVDARVLRNAEDGAALQAELRPVVSQSIADTLADLHAVNVDGVGLGDLGKRDGYVARQLKRWHSQFHAGTVRDDRVKALVDAVHQQLTDAAPPQQGASIVHGDYRLDNTMIGHDGRVAAVLDWEICTLGDPLADLGMLMTYWPEASDPFTPLGDSATQVDGFATRQQLVDRYARRSSRDVSDLPFYQAFGSWKLACILDGVSSRYKAGSMGDDGFAWQGLDDTVESLTASAADMLKAYS